MTVAAEALPDDPSTLKAMLIAKRAQNDRLRQIIKELQRHRFGRRAETLPEDQMLLGLEDVEQAAAGDEAKIDAANPAERASRSAKRRLNRGSLPAYLPRIEMVIDIDAHTCPCCGNALHRIGEDTGERLDIVPAQFRVLVVRRPKYACRACENVVVQAPAPARLIEGGLSTEATVAQVLVSKYADHLPLYRQAQIYERQGVELDRSTLADWVGDCSRLLRPLVEALTSYVMQASKLHADDIPVPVLEPGRGKTKTGRLWTYVRDDRASGSTDPPAVLFRYSPDRKGEHPRSHLKAFTGVLQADAYSGFNELYVSEQIVEAACWAHVRRKFYDFHMAKQSPIAAETLRRIGELYAIESDIRGRRPDERAGIRRSRAATLLDEFHTWLHEQLSRLSKKSDLAVAIRYALSNWVALTRYVNDGRLEIDNNTAERALRAVALGRKNYLFAGSDAGGDYAAALYSLIGTAKINDLDPEAYLRLVLERIADHAITRIDELLPWRVA